MSQVQMLKPNNGKLGTSVPDPEVRPKAKRRTFTAEYKLRILEAAANCTQPGERGALLRREGLYSSHLTHWRRERQAGTLAALKPKKRGRKVDPQPVENASLHRENTRLQAKLEPAEAIIEVQKKLSQLLELPMTSETDEPNALPK